MLVGIVARRESFVGMVGGDPQMPGREGGALGHRRVGIAEQQDVAAGDKLVRGLMPESVPAAPIGDHPVPAAQRVDHALSLRFPAQGPFHRPERVAKRVAWSRRNGLGVHLIDGVAQPVHRHVQAQAEEVLVMACQGLRCDQGAEVAGLARGQRAGQDDAGELHLELDGAVLVEVPVERVLVIARRDDERDDQPAAAAGLGRVQRGVEMLPQQAGVLLVQADRLPDRVRLAVRADEVDIEVADLPEAVAAELERVRHDPDPVLADVESVAPPLERPWIRVRDEQFRHRGAPDDRPYPAPVLVADGVQDEAFAGGEAEAKPPALPADLPAVDLEARSVRLSDLERLEVIPQRPDAIGGVGARARRHRHHAQVLDPHDRHLVEIHDGVEPVDGLGVGVVIGPLAVEQQRPSDPAPGFRGIGERADSPGLNQYPLGAGDATAFEACQNPGSALVTSSHSAYSANVTGAHSPGRIARTRPSRRSATPQPHRSCAAPVPAGRQKPPAAPRRRPVRNDCRRADLHRSSRSGQRRDLALERLVQAHRDEPRFGCYRPFPPEDLDSLRDLAGVEGIERMACSVAPLLIVGQWPSVMLPGHLAVSYHRRSSPATGAAFRGGFAQLRL